jgi:hypothetical protein
MVHLHDNRLKNEAARRSCTAGGFANAMPLVRERPRRRNTSSFHAETFARIDFLPRGPSEDWRPVFRRCRIFSTGKIRPVDRAATRMVAYRSILVGG